MVAVEVKVRVTMLAEVADRIVRMVVSWPRIVLVIGVTTAVCCTVGNVPDSAFAVSDRNSRVAIMRYRQSWSMQ